MKSGFILIFVFVFLLSCSAQESKKESNNIEQQVETLKSKICSSITDKINNNTNWAVALLDCDNEIMYSGNIDFFKLEYSLREKYPNEKMSLLIWKYKALIVKDIMLNCKSLNGIISEARMDEFIDVYKKSILDEPSNGDFFGETNFSTRNLFSDMLRFPNNDSIKVLFETLDKYNEKLKAIKQLNDIIVNNENCEFYYDNKNVIDGMAVFTITPYVGNKAIAQFKLQLKENDVVFRILDFELIDNSKIVFNPTVLENTPPPPPPPAF